jgi:hypothetical protein
MAFGAARAAAAGRVFFLVSTALPPGSNGVGAAVSQIAATQ